MPRTGYSVLELMVCVSLAMLAVVSGTPALLATREAVLADGAADYVARELHAARMEALKRCASVAIRFEADGDDFAMATYVDGNGNGVRATDISSGEDTLMGPRRLLRDQFAGVRFGFEAGVPDVDGADTSSEPGSHQGRPQPDAVVQPDRYVEFGNGLPPWPGRPPAGGARIGRNGPNPVTRLRLRVREMDRSLTGGPVVQIERRVSARVEVAPLSGAVHVRLPPGRQAVLLNLSRYGACIEAGSRLLPGAAMEVHLSTPGWNWRGRAIVTRCRVCALLPDRGARYVAALQFAAPLAPDGPDGTARGGTRSLRGRV